MSICAWFCTLCKKCHANGCPSLWGGEIEIPCNHKTIKESLGVTYETGTDEPLHPDPNIASRFIEVSLSNCEYGCKVYADPRSRVNVLGHNATYGCTSTKNVIGMEMEFHRADSVVDQMV